jgi:hypothetical protein
VAERKIRRSGVQEKRRQDLGSLYPSGEFVARPKLVGSGPSVFEAKASGKVPTIQIPDAVYDAAEANLASRSADEFKSSKVRAALQECLAARAEWLPFSVATMLQKFAFSPETLTNRATWSEGGWNYWDVAAKGADEATGEWHSLPANVVLDAKKAAKASRLPTADPASGQSNAAKAVVVTFREGSEGHGFTETDWQKIVAAVGRTETIEETWSCHAAAAPDARVYLLRTGNQDPGVIGRGTITAVPQTIEGKRQARVKFDWAVRVPPPTLGRAELRKLKRRDNWGVRPSGQPLAVEIADELDARIAAAAARREVDEVGARNAELAHSELNRLIRTALDFPTIIPRCFIYEGVPGTGKTYKLSALRSAIRDSEVADAGGLLRGNGAGRYAMTMHPATAYEDFVEGLRPKVAREEPETHRLVEKGYVAAPAVKSDQSRGERWFHVVAADAASDRNASFSVQDGFFVSICAEAAHYPTSTFVILLDELNRCNIPKVMGELLTTLERSKRATWTWLDKDKTVGEWDARGAQVVTMPYSKRQFFVPENVIVIGTMNTTDRSVAPMDAALRRRFAFERVWPIGFEPGRRAPDQRNLLAALSKESGGAGLAALAATVKLWDALNERLRMHGDDAMLGHSYLFDLARDLASSSVDGAEDVVKYHWNAHIFPQLVDILVSNDLVEKFLQGTQEPVRLKALGFDAVDRGFTFSLPELRGVGMMRVPTILMTGWRPVAHRDAEFRSEEQFVAATAAHGDEGPNTAAPIAAN